MKKLSSLSDCLIALKIVGFPGVTFQSRLLHRQTQRLSMYPFQRHLGLPVTTRVCISGGNIYTQSGRPRSPGEISTQGLRQTAVNGL